jgi:hypothetical protein
MGNSSNRRNKESALFVPHLKAVNYQAYVSLFLYYVSLPHSLPYISTFITKPSSKEEFSIIENQAWFKSKKFWELVSE